MLGGFSALGSPAWVPIRPGEKCCTKLLVVSPLNGFELPTRQGTPPRGQVILWDASRGHFAPRRYWMLYCAVICIEANPQISTEFDESVSARYVLILS